METALRIFQRGLDGVPAVKNRDAVAVARRAAPGRGLGLAGTAAGLVAERSALVAPGAPAGVAVIGISLAPACVSSRWRWLCNFWSLSGYLPHPKSH